MPRTFFRAVAAGAIALILSAAVPTAFAAGSASAPRAPLSTADRDFLRVAAESVMAEAQGSQLALQKSQSEDVRRFAQQLAQDQAAEQAQLMQIARQKGAELPDAPGLVDQGRLQSLQSVQGADFDLRYAELGVMANQGTVALFQQQAERGSDPDLRRFAGQVLPRLKAHLQVAQQLQAVVAAQAAASGTTMGAPGGAADVPQR